MMAEFQLDDLGKNTRPGVIGQKLEALISRGKKKENVQKKARTPSGHGVPE